MRKAGLDGRRVLEAGLAAGVGGAAEYGIIMPVKTGVDMAR